MAGEAVADNYLRAGDFYIYYSRDKKGQSVIPRAAIQMNGDQIGQVRGIASEQNLDPYIAPVVEAKLKEFPDGKAYEKKTTDMKMLTAIERKTKSGEKLNKDDLVFLYELNAPIEGFGYQRDPRIAELRDGRSFVDDIRIMYGYDFSAVNPGKEALDFMYEIVGPAPAALGKRIRELRAKRNPKEDMPAVFECSKEQIAHGIKEIKDGTKAYVGPLVPGIFDKIQEYSIEHVYTSFPEGRIRRETIKIGGKDAKTLIKEMDKKNIKRTSYAEDMMKSKDFKVLEETEDAILVRLKVKDLGIAKQYPTTDEIYKRIEELGLELCPAEVGPQYRLQYQNQPMDEWFWIGMK